ncbi:Integral membrane protein [Rasamsonia emersonii CBS 393.64]|uniref:Integral membrane protein n=1 Tax=Rasamsonia emersonii (strain ATCC 16479 / CBS 393.64 / IMI 116815) TaxID=1408163 RepID=A0A0F4Z2I5_RASE3|nr:Integral membrane protein [Rasamsonia emersonii CBS 393.64]KKA24291.1 Integral membrane protein [Rasamsonia emersonii CBS 393.64]
MESSRYGEEFTTRFRPQAAPSKAPTRGNVSRFAFGVARHTLGMGLLLVVVVLWTSSNFLASTILADDTYSKPFFVTYINTSFFITFLVIVIARRLFRLWRHGKLAQVRSWRTLLVYLDSHGMKDGLLYRDISEEDDYGGGHGENNMQRQRLLYNDAGESPDVPPVVADQTGITPGGRLGLRATARLSVQFCMLWFLANYFAIACLQYTNVGSTTILTSTSGVWTLIFGAVIGVEKFTVRKFFGVIASLVGVILISRVDMSSPDESTTPNNASGDNGQGSFPHKTTAEIALGDAMAAFSAIVYGIYTIVMKKQVGDESRVNMQLFFGLVGFFNVFLLWPGFIILHLLGIEEFGLPPTSRVWTIILVNSLSSLISDICWAYAMLLTTPLVVTVGLSLTIPLSLVGQIILQGRYASVLYWIGAVIVFLSFLIVNHESKEHDENRAPSLTSPVDLEPRDPDNPIVPDEEVAAAAAAATSAQHHQRHQQ